MAMIGKVRRMFFREKKSVREIVRLTSMSRNTVRKWLKAPVLEEPRYRRSEAPGKLTPFHESIKQALKVDAHRPRHERRTARALHTQIKAVLPHEGMLPVGQLSFWLLLCIFNSMVEGCGHVVEGCGGGQRRPRSGALSTVAAGAPQAHRPHVHSQPAGREVFPRLFHTSAGMTVGLRSLPRIISFARSARQPLTRRCNVRNCALPA